MRKTRKPLAAAVLFASMASFSLLSASCEKKGAAGKLSGQVTLSVELQKTLQDSAALYVIARRPGEPSGPPLAVKRFAGPLKFPVDFTLTASDVMLQGLSFDGNVAVSARVSQSGAAMPVNPGDIEGFAQAPFVPVGTSGVEVALTQVRR